ncbi:uncharacterized protein LOC126304730 [Schistocerca gregaria]|uniref:uncharacterized protein LOC126304730 n=1 Tax=Schistocerca gregaria TaxID=7010 RepID=UPI00211EB008|nr:uncharacterized protein LOC126304730 [Schistocerca gregaria]
MPYSTEASTITIAGIPGVQGYRDSLAKEAIFGSPVDVVLDPKDGSVYIADWMNNCIRCLHSGRVSTVAGTGQKGHIDGPAAEAQFNTPCSLAFDNFGGLIILECHGHRLRRLYRGHVSTIAGSGIKGYLDGPALYARFRFPRGIAFDSLSGDIVISDSGNNRIRKLLPTGEVITIAGCSNLNGSCSTCRNYVSHAATFSSPRGIAVTIGSGNIIVADYGNNMVRCISQNFVSTLVSPNDNCYKPYAVSVDQKLGFVYFSELGSNRIRRISLYASTKTICKNNVHNFVDYGTTTPIGIDVDSDTADVIFADLRNYRICRILYYFQPRPISFKNLLEDSVRSFIGKCKHLSIVDSEKGLNYRVPQAILSVRCRPLLDDPTLLEKLSQVPPNSLSAFVVYLLSDNYPNPWPIHCLNQKNLDQCFENFRLWAGLWTCAVWTQMNELATFCSTVTINQLRAIEHPDTLIQCVLYASKFNLSTIINKCILNISRKPKLFIHRLDLLLELTKQRPSIGQKFFDAICTKHSPQTPVRCIHPPPKKLNSDMAQLIDFDQRKTSSATKDDNPGATDFIIELQGFSDELIKPEDCASVLDNIEYYGLSTSDISTDEYEWLCHHYHSMKKGKNQQLSKAKPL